MYISHHYRRLQLAAMTARGAAQTQQQSAKLLFVYTTTKNKLKQRVNIIPLVLRHCQQLLLLLHLQERVKMRL